MLGVPLGVLVALGAILALVVGGTSLRGGIRTLSNRTLNPAGGLDNLAVTLIVIGIILIGWGVVGPVLWLAR